MSFDLDKNVDLGNAKVITLGGRELHVAPLLLRTIIAATEMRKGRTNDPSPKDYIDYLIDFVLLGLKRTYPQVTRDDLLDSEITVEQLTVAAEIVTEQGGAKKVDSAGEAVAASLGPPGVSSSPSSVLN